MEAPIAGFANGLREKWCWGIIVCLKLCKSL